MAGIKITSNLDEVRNRIVARLEKTKGNSEEMKKALFAIGNTVRNSAIDNVTEIGAVDSGILRSSISFDIVGNENLQTLTVGAFGVKYARMVEFGGIFTDRMRRAMFASFKDRGKPPRPGKGIIGSGQYKARPFIGPAIQENKDKIRDILLRVPKGGD